MAGIDSFDGIGQCLPPNDTPSDTLAQGGDVSAQVKPLQQHMHGRTLNL